jgi:hypothetical protein
MKLRNFDIEQSILAGDITVLLTVGAPRVQLCPFIFNAGSSFMCHPDVGAGFMTTDRCLSGEERI